MFYGTPETQPYLIAESRKIDGFVAERFSPLVCCPHALLGFRAGYKYRRDKTKLHFRTHGAGEESVCLLLLYVCLLICLEFFWFSNNMVAQKSNHEVFAIST